MKSSAKKKNNKTNQSRWSFFHTERLGAFWILFAVCCLLVVHGYFLNLFQRRAASWDILAPDNFPADVSAVSYLVGDIDSGKIWVEKNGAVHFFPASLSKLMAAIVVLENFSADEEIIISPYAVSAEGEEGNLMAYEVIRAGDLLQILLISSSNDAAIALAESLEAKGGNFVSLMNQKAREFKLFNSAFFDPSGLDREGNFSSAEDLFKLSRRIYQQYPLLGQITSRPEATVYSADGQIVHDLKNTNVLAGQIADLWGGKTGFTPEAKDCLLTIYEFSFPEKDDKIAVAIVVLNSADRFGDTMKIYEWTKQQLENNNHH